MKKKFIMPMIAVAAISGAVLFSAFKAEDKSENLSQKWFEFTNVLGDGDVNNPANYMITPSDGANAPGCPEGSDERCAVLALPGTNPDQPNLSGGSVIEIRQRAIE
nr:hypothetical protein [Pedobacter glucosidilyticus]